MILKIGDYELVTIDEKFGECPAILSVKYIFDKEQNWDQINLDDFTSGSGESFHNLIYVDRDYFSKFEESTLHDLFKKVVYETHIYPNRVGFVLAHSFQKQKRDSIVSDWNKAWYKVDTRLNLESSEMTGNFLTVLVIVTDESRNFVDEKKLECKYIKYLRSEVD